MNEPHSLSEDQAAIERYLQSDLYEAGRDSDNHSPNQPFDNADDVATGLASFAFGLAGPAVLLAILAFSLPIVMSMLTSKMISPSFLSTQAIFQTVCVPPIVCFSIVTVTPLFWYGPITLRFLVGAASVVPGCLAFAAGIAVTDALFPANFWEEFTVVMFAQFTCAALVAVSVQMWSPWTLTHHRDDDSTSIPPTGTRTMMELTGIAAVGFAFIVSRSLQAIIEGILFFGGVGLLTGGVVVGIERALLKRDRSRRIGSIALSVGGTYLIAIFFSGFFAAMEFGRSFLLSYLHLVLLAALWGTVLICGTFVICLAWLRYWGWACVHRRELMLRGKDALGK